MLSLNYFTRMLYETTRRWPCKENPISESGTCTVHYLVLITSYIGHKDFNECENGRPLASSMHIEL